MGYSFCKMADFQKSLIFIKIRVFWNGFFAQNNCNVLLERFSACFGIFNLWLKLSKGQRL